MLKIVTAQEMQAIDKTSTDEFGIPDLVLMENAGFAVASILKEKFPDLKDKKVLVVAGKGNNGGDGLVVARQLFNIGIKIQILLIGKVSSLKGSARINADIAKNIGIPFLEVKDDNLKSVNHKIKHGQIIVDAIFGTGLKRKPEGIFKKVIESINKSKNFVASIDIPSGLNSDSGQIDVPFVKANLTICLALFKRSHCLLPATEAMGEIKLVDICIPAKAIEKQDTYISLVEEEDIRHTLVKRPMGSHKGNFGHLLVVAGSKGKGGASGLSALSALRVGTGLVTMAVPECCHSALEFNPLEVMTAPLPETKAGSISFKALDILLKLSENKTAIALGPGISTEHQTIALMLEYFKLVKCPLIIDADGINCLARRKEILDEMSCPVILTPHPKEFSRLVGITTSKVQSNRIDTASKFAKDHSTIIILKGAGTVIALPDGNVFINPTGNPGMATAGTGDVLTGIVGGFAAQGLNIDKAAITGAYIHGLAGDHYAKDNSQSSLIASDLVNSLPNSLKQILY
ncbi:MAG: NAD(P)H-hydrate dehydratase [Nitrospinales bacterium]